MTAAWLLVAQGATAQEPSQWYPANSYQVELEGTGTYDYQLNYESADEFGLVEAYTEADEAAYGFTADYGEIYLPAVQTPFASATRRSLPGDATLSGTAASTGEQTNRVEVDPIENETTTFDCTAAVGTLARPPENVPALLRFASEGPAVKLWLSPRQDITVETPYDCGPDQFDSQGIHFEFFGHLNEEGHNPGQRFGDDGNFATSVVASQARLGGATVQIPVTMTKGVSESGPSAAWQCEMGSDLRSSSCNWNHSWNAVLTLTRTCSRADGAQLRFHPERPDVDGRPFVEGRCGDEGGTPDPSANCVVPKLKGKRLKRAKRALRRADCRPGKVTRRRSNRIKRGRVIRTKPKKGAVKPQGKRVKLVVSKGKRRRS